jgi:hypothetical protein
MPQVQPAWLRRTEGEARLPVAVAMVAAIALQAVLPDDVAIRPRWPLTSVEGALLVALMVYNPVRMKRTHPVARIASLVLIVLMTAANAFSAGRLIDAILSRQIGNDAIQLFGGGAAIYLTNIVAFALWYWEYDRGGPVARADARDPHPDFLFPQMANPEVADPDWEPTFIDYLYVSFTNATAFSPTDTMPLSRWAKSLMALQSTIALAALALVIARAVNILHN